MKVSCTRRWRALLYYYIFVSSRAATNLGSRALWGRLEACGRLSIGQMSLTSSTPRLRLAALRGRLVACGRLSIGQMSLMSSTPRLRLAAMRGRLATCGRLAIGLGQSVSVFEESGDCQS